MICSTLLPISSLAGLALAGAQAPAQPTPAANVVKVYDLSPALPGGSEAGPGRALLPILVRGPSTEEPEWSATGGEDMVIDLLRGLAGEEFEYEGRQIISDGQGHLVVVAPPAVQAMTERYLAFLESVFGATTELVIDALEIPSANGEPETSVLLPMADADKLIARAGAAGRRTWRLPVRAGRVARLDLTRTESLVTDYDVEIAQGSAIADPVSEDVTVGTQIAAGVAPAPGGMWLALALRRGDPLSGVREHELGLQLSLKTQDRLAHDDSARTYQDVDVLNRSLAFSTFLPEGKALAVRTSVVAAEKSHVEVLVVRRGAGALPIFAQGSLDPKSVGGRRDVLFVNAQSAVPPRCEIEVPALLGGVFDAWPLLRVEVMEREVYARIPSGSYDLLREIVRGVDDSLTVRDAGACFFLTHEEAVKEGEPAKEKKGDPRTDPRMDPRMEAIASLAPPARVAQVAVSLRRAAEGTEIARLVLPLRDGEPAVVVLGSEGIEVADLNVEVGQDAAIADPLMRVAFDGVVVWLRPAFTSSGDLAVDVLARAHVRSGPSRELDLRVAALGKIDQSTYDQLFVREKLLFRKAEGSPRAFVLGESGSAGSKGSLALQVEASEAK